MSLRQHDIRIVKTSPASEPEARAKANFDAALVHVRHEGRYAATREAVEYFRRQLLCEVRALDERLKVLA